MNRGGLIKTKAGIFAFRLSKQAHAAMFNNGLRKLIIHKTRTVK